MKKILSFLFCLIAVISASAQNVTGKVTDENNAPLDFVNVVILNADSAFVAGTITAEDGSFLFENPGPKAKLVKLSSIGYANVVSPIPPSGSLGTVAMQPVSVMLGEVVVKSSRPATAIKGGALVTSVEGSQLAHAGTANDVLAQVPMVIGDNGNFEVFGKGAPTIYINGRQVQDPGMLEQLQSSDIKSVEVVTNPGAKYDASVKSVIRIRTKKPQGEGFSGLLRTEDGIRHDFFTNNQLNLKYRTGGLELFTNLGFYWNKGYENKVNDVTTFASTVWDQKATTVSHLINREMFGKFGFSYMFNENHSIGAYYQNGYGISDARNLYTTEVFANHTPYDFLTTDGKTKERGLPRHYANLYYNGNVGKLGIDFNMDYMWKKNRQTLFADEESNNYEDAGVNSYSTDHSRMFAEKLTLSYPVWKGSLEIGEEYTGSRFANNFATDAVGIGNATSVVDEKNIATFVQLSQQFGKFNVAAGLRYEHVRFDYTENGQLRDEQSKTYNNLFPSLDVSTTFGKVQWAMSYSHKTKRPTYAALDGTVTYINRFLLESGNPYLTPSKIHSIEMMAAWRNYFINLNYGYEKDPIYNASMPYGENGEVRLLTKENLPKVQTFNAFIGARFKVGFWQPVVNVGILKQWLNIDYRDGRKSLDNPLGIVQFQNAFHIPGDIWLNVNMQWMSEGNGENAKLSSTSYMNVKLYKAFLNNQFSVTLEANDIFNKNLRDFTFYSKDVLINQRNLGENRTFMVTLQYNFNASRNRYKGQGAGNEEKNRF